MMPHPSVISSSPSDTASNHRKIDTSAIPLRKPENSQCYKNQMIIWVIEISLLIMSLQYNTSKSCVSAGEIVHLSCD